MVIKRAGDPQSPNRLRVKFTNELRNPNRASELIPRTFYALSLAQTTIDLGKRRPPMARLLKSPSPLFSELFSPSLVNPANLAGINRFKNRSSG